MPRGEDIAEGERRVTNWLVRAGLAVLTLALVVSAAALLPVTSLLPEPWHRLPALPCAGWFVAAWMASFVGIVWAWVKFEPCRVMGAFGCVAVTFMAYWYLAAQPALEEYRTQRPFADAVKREIELHGLSLYGTREIVAHLDPPAPLVEYHTPAALSKAIEAHRVDCLIVRRRDWANLHLAGSIVIAETVQPWEDAALAQSKLLLIRMP